MTMPRAGWANATADTMVRVVAKLRDWEPLDWDVTFDALASVLDCQAPLDDELEELAQRLRGALMQVVTIAVAGFADEDEEAAVLIARARTLRSEELPGDYWKALGHLRRLGWVTSELVELLSKTGHFRDAA
ncbi:hypothetical protein QF037_006329 [Streptomyces canus]|uniref:DUF6415 family natural product biosynthesis protein n=1 Tax=Streptomyces canus TaxID=58343 RepID=UPI00278B017F|nr:DUF6415 family natural product biosynthesis protein [Streptomyces canus]MDQ0601984.1 hypothetical protein [Streptomyces canus]